MPYAFAHPAAAVPVAKLLGRRAVPSALAIGSMIPDAWYFVPFVGREETHTALGALLFCMPAGLALYVAFHVIFKQPMLALAPPGLAARLGAWAKPGLPAVAWTSVLLCLLAGIATHLVWDAFTHAGPLKRILQHASTLTGTAFLVWWAWRKLRATEPLVEVRSLDERTRIAVLAAMVLIPAAAFVSVLQSMNDEALRVAARAAGVTAVSAFGLLALSFSLAWKRGRLD